MNPGRLIVLALAACGGGSARAPDAAPSDADIAAVHACEAQLASQWAQTPPTTGLGTADARAAYEPMLRSLLATYAIPGASVAVTKDGKLVAAFGVGMADPDALEVAHPDSRWRIASLSKQITAVAILHLVADGALSLDDHPFQILSDLTPLGGANANPALANITVRQLLEHLGGWNRDVGGDPMFMSQTISAASGIAGPADTDTIIRYMLDKPLTYTPGTTYCYSNFGYAVLGAVIAKKSGTSYEQYVQTHVLAPAGALEIAQGKTRLADRQDGEVRYVGYAGEGTTGSVFPADTQPVPWEYGGFYLEAMAAHGAWIASPVDMERFAKTIDLAAMSADPHVPTCRADGGTDPENTNYWYGFGLELNTAGNAWHTGSLPGTTTEDVLAGNGFSWSIFTNTRTATPGQPDSAIDQHGWDPIRSVANWGTIDLFDQYPAWSAWMTASDFDAALAAARAHGNYPTRLEARSDGELRARFAPLPSSATADVATGLDCPTYVARAAAATAHGQDTVSLQSYVDAGGVRRYQAVWATPY